MNIKFTPTIKQTRNLFICKRFTRIILNLPLQKTKNKEGCKGFLLLINSFFVKSFEFKHIVVPSLLQRNVLNYLKRY